VKWNRQTAMWVGIVFATVAFERIARRAG